jgi:Dyp-type peroxidase family
MTPSLRFERSVQQATTKFLYFLRWLDPFYRRFFNVVFREHLAWLLQVLINLRRPHEGLKLAEEKPLAGEIEALDSIIADMGAYMRQHYQPGGFLRAGNTKTHGVVRGEVITHKDVPENMRHGIFAEPRTFKAWVRFSGPGPDSPPDIKDVGFTSIAIKLMGVAGPKLLDDEKHTQDLIAVCTPTFVTPNIVENAKLQSEILRGTSVFYFWRPGGTHILDFFMQSLWNETQTSPLEARYWSSVPYLLGEGQAMMYSIQPKLATHTRIPRWPFHRPPDNYLRDALAATLAKQDVEFDILVQVQTDSHRMPIENAAVRWPERLSPFVPVATLRLPQQKNDWAKQFKFAHELSYNPWHCIPEHRPLGNQNRARRRMYWALSTLRQTENQIPHAEPTGDEDLESASSDTSCEGASRWEDQHGVTVFAAVRPDVVNDLKQELHAIGTEVAASGKPFGRSSRIHIARFVFIREDLDPALGRVGPALAYIAEFDGSVGEHLDEIARIAAGEFDQVGKFFIDPVPGTFSGRRRWLQDHVIPDATFYVNTIGRTVQQIRCEAQLREEIEKFLDDARISSQRPAARWEQVQNFVRNELSLQWALKPVEDRGWRVRRTFARVAIILLAIPALIVALPLLIVWALAIRWLEKTEIGDPPRPEPAHVAALRSREDWTVQNQFSALSFRKPPWLRLATAAVFLWLAKFVVRYFFDRENLAGIRTIHFARWTFIDGKRRMLFTTSYDGSHENYMSDFIDIVAWGMNAIFSNGPQWPRTRWLILDGAWNEGAFKYQNRNRMIETHVWYSAYPNLSARNIAENARLRAALSAPQTEKLATDWLRLLRRDWGKPLPEPIKLERDDIQGLLVRGHSHHKAACFFPLVFPAGDEGRAAAKQWLKELIADDTVMIHGSPKRSDRYAHVAFTHEGLKCLGCPASLLDGFSDEFRFGMTTPHRRRVLGDDGPNAPELWKWGRPGEPLHALLLLYARDATQLPSLCARQEANFQKHGITVHGKSLPTTWFANKKEHFGFHDGITTPIIEGLNRDAEPGRCIKPGEFILGYQNEYGRYTARPLIHRALDPRDDLKLDIEGSGAADFGRNGTYLVFRQLQQHVRPFWSFIDDAVRKLDGTTQRRVWLASKMVGRWPSGAPLVLAPDQDNPALADVDDFKFHGQDPGGLRCPIGAHIRRTNPRDSLEPRPGSPESLSVNKRHRLLRRGRTYGDQVVKSMDPEDILAMRDDGEERGLHFICLGANIARQFEFVQATWVNNPQFEGLDDVVDPLIGQRGRFRNGSPPPATGTFTIPDTPWRRRVHNVPDFVSMRGGAYFFMPGLSALRYLARTM